MSSKPARLELPDGTVYLGRILAGERRNKGARRIVLKFEIIHTTEDSARP